MKTFALKTALGVLARALVLAPFAGVLYYTGEYANYVQNTATFVLVVLGIATVLYLVVMGLIPPEYAIKTELTVLEFNMWLPQIIAVYVMGCVSLVMCILVASQAMYVTAVVLFLYGISNFLWPRYVKRIDNASKEHMVTTLSS